MQVSELVREAERQLTICNACRYCEAYCAVFPALERRTSFARNEVTYIANLCHDCRACYYACMYVPPHEFAVNLPLILAASRVATYEEYAWPRIVGRWLGHGGLKAIALLSVAEVVPQSVEFEGGPPIHPIW